VFISREKLYEEVWRDPATVVAERYGVSDRAVGKWCEKLNLPRPAEGIGHGSVQVRTPESLRFRPLPKKLQPE